jgi:SM-20-related protein
LALLDLACLDAAPLRREPFDFVIVDGFLREAAIAGLIADFPSVDGAGSYPAARLCGGPSFARLIAELEDAPLRRAIEDKFAIDLEGRPTMVTVRGFSDGNDGNIHTDSASKLITLLLYLNREWPAAGGRLRLLRRADDLADCAAEVAPLAGAMVAFRRSRQSFHGHYPHLGERRVIQLNWVADRAVVRRELGRHAWSARLKALIPFGLASAGAPG